jgi:hypothetical protein
MKVVRHDYVGTKQIRIASVVLENLLQQYRPPLVTKEWLPTRSLRAGKVGLSATPFCFSGWTHGSLSG